MAIRHSWEVKDWFHFIFQDISSQPTRSARLSSRTIVGRGPILDQPADRWSSELWFSRRNQPSIVSLAGNQTRNRLCNHWPPRKHLHRVTTGNILYIVQEVPWSYLNLRSYVAGCTVNLIVDTWIMRSKLGEGQRLLQSSETVRTNNGNPHW